MPPDVVVDIDRLRALTQANADYSDAVHAQSAPFCIYLLEMREFFRWEGQLSFGKLVSRAELGPWMGAKETRWEMLRDGLAEIDAAAHSGTPYRALFPQISEDPFDTEALSEILASAGLAYGAGVGCCGRSQFFLGKVLAREMRAGCEIVLVGEELARGAIASPVVGRGNDVLIRLDAYARWLWTRYEEWQLHPRDSSFGIAWQGYSVCPEGAEPEEIVRRMAHGERELLILRELGVRRVDALLGDVWQSLLDELQNRKVELLVRSVRDLYADCAVTLPTLLERGEFNSIHCWFGLLDGLRLKLASGIVADYHHWSENKLFAWHDRLQEATAHWHDAAASLLDLWENQGTTVIEQSLLDDRWVFE